MRGRFLKSATVTAAVIILTNLPFSVMAETGTETPEAMTSGTTGDCSWTLNADGALTISGTGKMGDYFNYNLPWGKKITSVVIENGVTNIGTNAFTECEILKSITIPDSVTSIGDNAFYNCIRLTEVELPDTLTTIADYVFEYCTALTSIVIPDSVTSMGVRTFYGCSGLKSAVIGNRVPYIGCQTFYGCTALVDVTLGRRITSIGKEAFTDCLTMRSFTFPDSVTSIDEFAFYNCQCIKSITFGNHLKSIGYYAFDLCYLEQAVIPPSVTDIDDTAFLRSDNMTIYGNKNSYAETFAAKQGFPFIAVELQPPVTIGDIDCDGTICIKDVTELQRCLAELITLSSNQLAAADTNGDGTVNINDATHLQKYLAEFDVVLG